MSRLLELFLNLDQHLKELIRDYGGWAYAFLFGIVFCETGIVVLPFLPGDSLLFAAGIYAGKGDLNIVVLLVLFVAAALCGDNSNYFIGKTLGSRMFRNGKSRFLKRSNLDRTHAFFERYGGKTIIIARFVPIVRTFAPFVAGMGAMTYRRFISFSIAAAVLWVSICTGSGYYFSRYISKERFHLAVIALIALSLLPVLFEYVAHRRRNKSASQNRAGI